MIPAVEANADGLVGPTHSFAGLSPGNLASADNKGLASALYEQKLASGEKIVLSSQLDTLNLNGKPPKVGLAFDLA